MTDSAEWPRVLGCLNVYKESRPNGFKNKLEFQNIAGAETLPPPIQHGTADSMGAIGKHTPFASIVWMRSAVWIALVESV